MPKRKVHSGEFKARVALEMLKGRRTANEVASTFGIHPVQAAQWKKQAIESLPSAMADRRHRENQQTEVEKRELYEEIGRLRMQLEWVKKKSGISPAGSE